MAKAHAQRWAAVAVAVVLMGAATGCSSTNAPAGDSSTQANPTAPADSGSAASSDTAAMCDAFAQIAAGATGSDPTTKEGWDLKVEWTTVFVDAAPLEWQSAAQTYLGIVEDREVLLASYDYPLITDLPSDVRSAFIADHTDAQNEANTFIAFAKDSCEID